MSDNTNDLLEAALPPRPGNHPVTPKDSGRPSDPKLSPHFNEGEEPVWFACRATTDCEGKYAVKVQAGELDLQAGGGTFTRYKCLTCGGRFHVRC
jgi:hypothetical protein